MKLAFLRVGCAYLSEGGFALEELGVGGVVRRGELGVDEDGALSYSLERSRPLVREAQPDEQLQNKTSK